MFFDQIHVYTAKIKAAGRNDFLNTDEGYITLIRKHYQKTTCGNGVTLGNQDGQNFILT